jgi:hypothetical protein
MNEAIFNNSVDSDKLCALWGTKFICADLSGSYLVALDLSRTEISSSILARARLEYSFLGNIELHFTDLHDCHLDHAEISNIDVISPKAAPKVCPVLEEYSQDKLMSNFNMAIQDFNDSIYRVQLVRSGFNEKEKRQSRDAENLSKLTKIIRYLDNRMEKAEAEKRKMNSLIQRITSSLQRFDQSYIVRKIHNTGSFIRDLNLDCLNAHNEPPDYMEMPEIPIG